MLGKRPKHWTRQLRDGRIEFYMRQAGSTVTGAADFGQYMLVRRMFEAHVHRPLPPAQHKRPR